MMHKPQKWFPYKVECKGGVIQCSIGVSVTAILGFYFKSLFMNKANSWAFLSNYACISFDSKLGKSFYFRGCGWPCNKSRPAWSIEDKAWIQTVNKLMDNILRGKEFLEYYHDEKKVCYVDEEDLPDYKYSHADWEDKYLQNYNSTPMSPQSPAEKKGRTTEPCVKQKSKPPVTCLFPNQMSESCSKPQAKPSHIHVSHSPNISALSSTVLASLKRCMSQTATRQELSQTKLPPVTTLIQEKDIVVIHGEFREDNPNMIKSRPSGSIMVVAHKVMKSCSIQMI